MIKEGKSENDIKEYSFRLWSNHMMDISNEIADRQGQRSWKTKVVVIWGSTGIGKSRWCQQTFPEAYWKPKGKWWNGYAGQETVVMDDFYGWLEIDCLLRVCDRYPLIIEKKGSVVQFLAKRIIFTSNRPWSEWYKAWRPEHLNAMRRRIEFEFHGDLFEEAEGVTRVVWERHELDDAGRDGWVPCGGPQEFNDEICRD